MAKLTYIKESVSYMMSFVCETNAGNCIVIDGGRPEDMPSLKEATRGKHISAWILTHAHSDHISGFLSEVEKNGLADFDVEAIYCNFPDYTSFVSDVGVPDPDYFKSDVSEMLPTYEKLRPRFEDKLHVPVQGDVLYVDEVKIEFIFSFHDGLYANPMNDSSLVFKLYGDRKSVLFLGDLGPDAGDILFRESREKLKSDIVQMAHHGHMGVSMEVYAEIAPEACIWCAIERVYNEPILPLHLADGEKMRKMGRLRMYGTALTRKWMDMLGVKTHYVTMNGTGTIEI